LQLCHAIAALLIAFASPAGAETVTLQVANGQFNEIVRDSAQISGVVVAGALRHGKGPIAQLSVIPDPSWEGEFICARVLSADGLYEAENAYAIPHGWSGGAANLAFPTQHADLLFELDAGAVAVRVTQGNCTVRNPDAALAIWRDADGEKASLLVNAFAAQEVFMYVGSKAVKCVPLPISGLAAFDHSCELPDTLSGNVELTIYRVKNGSSPDPAKIRLFIGDF